METTGSAGPFVLQLATLKEGETAKEMVAGASELELDPQHATLESPIALRATIYRAGGKIEVRGEVTAHVRQTCDRCLKPVETPVQVPLQIFSEPRGSRDPRGEEELREEDLGIVYHDGQYIDLTEEVRQVVLVEMPWHVLCEESCKGLCPYCGVNRNEDPCKCADEQIDRRWSALRKIKNKNTQ